MLFWRLLATTTCLLFSTIIRTSKATPIPISNKYDDETIAAVVAKYKKFHESLKEDYTREDCIEKWGEFPSEGSERIDPSKLHFQRMKEGCKCGSIYDLAWNTILRDEENEQPTNSVFDVSSGVAAGSLASRSSSRNQNSLRRQDDDQITQVEAWVIAESSSRLVRCENGRADGFPCDNVDLIAHMPLSEFRTGDDFDIPREVQDVWGWTSSDNREFIILGAYEGIFFVEILVGVIPVIMGYLPGTRSSKSMWHDMKVIGDYVYIVSENKSHQLQIFDLSLLLDIDPEIDCVDFRYCVELEPTRTYEGTSDNPIRNAHNIVANENTDYLYLVGGDSCDGGLYVVDVIDPLRPFFVACFEAPGRTYVHDAICVTYDGPDRDFQNREICFCFNEDAVVIVDVDDKLDMKVISEIFYDDIAYTHQGWLSSDQSYLVFGDEVDEMERDIPKTRTLVVNVENLRQPEDVVEFLGTTEAVDHNQYVVDYLGVDLIYQANYNAGLSILQVFNYETADMKEVAYFDTQPGTNRAETFGAWSVYPYFRSGVIAVSDISGGLFLLKPDLKSALITPEPTDAPVAPTVAPVAPTVAPVAPTVAPVTVTEAPTSSLYPTASDAPTNVVIPFVNRDENGNAICEDLPRSVRFNVIFGEDDRDSGEEDDKKFKFCESMDGFNIRQSESWCNRDARIRGKAGDYEDQLPSGVYVKVYNLCPKSCRACADTCADFNQVFTVEGAEVSVNRRCTYLGKRTDATAARLCRNRIAQLKRGRVRQKPLTEQCPKTCGLVGEGKCAAFLSNSIEV